MRELNYFEFILNESEKLTQKGNEYLEKLPLMHNDEVAKKIYEHAKRIYDEKGDEGSPDWVLEALDGYIPYYAIPKNGSLYFTFAFSPSAQEAKLRNFLEVLEGRECDFLDFDCIVSKELVHKHFNLK